MHSVIYVQVCFKLGMMINTLHFETSLSDLDLVQDHWCLEKALTSATNFVTTFRIDLDEIWCTVETC